MHLLIISSKSKFTALLYTYLCVQCVCKYIFIGHRRSDTLSIALYLRVLSKNTTEL